LKFPSRRRVAAPLLPATPPEYNPYRRYPMVVTLNGGGTTAEQQIDWWAGSWGKNGREGQAARRGYIVLAPEWTAEHQEKYDYSAHEHAIVLACFRDACRRFAVDTDRVFLSGHDIAATPPGTSPGASRSLGGRHPRRRRIRPLLRPLLGKREEPAVLSRLRRTGRQPHGEKLPRSEPLSPTRIQHDGGRVPRPRPRAFLRRDLAVVRLMGRFHRDFFPREFSCTTMREGEQLLLVGRTGVDAAAGDGQSERMAPPRNLQPVQVKANVTAGTTSRFRPGRGG